MDDPRIRSFVQGLLNTGEEAVPPALVLVEDYQHRRELADALKDEADIHGVDLHRFSSLSQLPEALPRCSAEGGSGALVLLDEGRGEEWGRWLEAYREHLPGWFRLVFVLSTTEELLRLASAAPSFFSWAKGQIYGARECPPEPTRTSEAATIIEEIKSSTGLSPEEFVSAWKEGRLPDTFRNSAWLNWAVAFLSAQDQAS